MKCKKCNEYITPDCMLMEGECVFCAYKTNEWDSNGELITKEQSIKSAEEYEKFCLSQKLKPYWKEKEKLIDEFDKKLHELEMKMTKEMHVRNSKDELIELEFFWCDNSIVGIGAAVNHKDFPLIQNFDYKEK